MEISGCDKILSHSMWILLLEYIYFLLSRQWWFKEHQMANECISDKTHGASRCTPVVFFHRCHQLICCTPNTFWLKNQNSSSPCFHHFNLNGSSPCLSRTGEDVNTGLYAIPCVGLYFPRKSYFSAQIISQLYMSEMHFSLMFLLTKRTQVWVCCTKPCMHVWFILTVQ
jgi:hypothetical protein